MTTVKDKEIRQFGFRYYEIDRNDMQQAMSIWAMPCGQNGFEALLRYHDIEFNLIDIEEVA